MRKNENASIGVCKRERNRVERLINRLKQNRRIATRYEKYAINYQAMLTIASILLWHEKCMGSDQSNEQGFSTSRTSTPGACLLPPVD
ncbi:MAG: transposase [Moorea sp. SIO3E2]|nr:transposase [Moorena sp. SIO3E2]